MTQRLYLLRHAKSSWDDPGLPDHDRPLAPRGRRAAAAIGQYLAEQGIVPELVLCSTAVRTRETFERIGLDAPVRYEPELYGASADALLARVPDELGSVMLIGHNPGMEDLLLALTGEPVDKFPTGALAVVEGGELTAFVRPRDLTE